MTTTTRVVPGKLFAERDADAVARSAASAAQRMLEHALEARGCATLALSGGSTPRAMYALLADAPLPWERVTLIQVDERAVAPTSDRSNYRLLSDTFLSKGAKAATTLRMEGECASLDDAAASYEAALDRRLGSDGVLDVVVLGVGDDGHTASIFPGSTLVGDLTGRVAAVPAEGTREARLTLKESLLVSASNVLVLATGAAKHGPLERIFAVSGDDSATPARVVRRARGAVHFFVDRAAAGV